jgi:hypothetical protein
MKCANESEFARFVAGLVEPEAAAALREHVEHCTRCHAVQTRMAASVGRLAPDPGEFDAPEFVGDVLASIRQEPRQPQVVSPRPARQRRWLWAPVAALSATAILLAARPFLWPGDSDGFRARGSASHPDRWVSIEIHRATAAGYKRLHDTLAAHDALAFAYSNMGDEGYRYLDVFAVDEQGEVFWYYPAPARGADGGLPIARTRRAELPDEIRHELRPGLLRIFAVFAKDPLTVAELERTVRRDLRDASSLEHLERLSLAGTGQQTFLLTVLATHDAGMSVEAR